MPSYKFWETPFYGIGPQDVRRAGRRPAWAPPNSSAGGDARLPADRAAAGLKGGVKYWDGQFDDARLALALARTAARQGALLVNYCAVTGLCTEGGKLAGLPARDAGNRRVNSTVRAHCVVNATGVWVDQLRQQDAQAIGRTCGHGGAQPGRARGGRPRLPARATHALMVPKTADGRVLFGVPWMGKLILGTTDTPRGDLPREPRPFPGGAGLHPGARRPATWCARPARRTSAASGWACGRWSSRRTRRGQHQGAQPRAHGAGQPQRAGDGHRRQMDDLPGDGRGRAGEMLHCPALLPARAECC
jgi:glycerol-3-phosphate dehydrogenase